MESKNNVCFAAYRLPKWPSIIYTIIYISISINQNCLLCWLSGSSTIYNYKVKHWAGFQEHPCRLLNCKCNWMCDCAKPTDDFVHACLCKYACALTDGGGDSLPMSGVFSHRGVWKLAFWLLRHKRDTSYSDSLPTGGISTTPRCTGLYKSELELQGRSMRKAIERYRKALHHIHCVM